MYGRLEIICRNSLWPPACKPSRGRRQFPHRPRGMWPRGIIRLAGETTGMNVVPVGDHVVVKRLEAEEKTRGGILLPDAAQEQPSQGRVLSVGDGRQMKNGTHAGSQVSEGDRILFSPYSGMEVEIDGEPLLIMSEHDILAVID